MSTRLQIVSAPVKEFATLPVESDACGMWNMGTFEMHLKVNTASYLRITKTPKYVYDSLILMASNLRHCFEDGQVILVFYISCLDTGHDIPFKIALSVQKPVPTENPPQS